MQNFFRLWTLNSVQNSLRRELTLEITKLRTCFKEEISFCSFLDYGLFKKEMERMFIIEVQMLKQFISH